MEIPRHWRLKAQRYRLEGSACPTCGQLSFPPRPVCPHCTAQPAQMAVGEHPAILASKHTFETVSLKG
jgi:uncharacterized OB-fold protein